MADLVGADVAALRRFAALCAKRQQDVDDSRRRLDVVIEGLDWVGLDRQRFLDEWRSVHAVALAAVAGELAAAGRRAAYHAARQEQASRS